MTEFASVCTQVFKRTSGDKSPPPNRSVNMVVTGSGCISERNPHDDSEKYSEHDVEVVTCLYTFAKEHDVVGVEYSADNGQTLWYRFRDAATAKDFITTIESVWPTRTKELPDVFEPVMTRLSLPSPALTGGPGDVATPRPISLLDGHTAAPPQCQCSYIGIYINESECRRRLERGQLLQYIQVMTEMLWQSMREASEATVGNSSFFSKARAQNAIRIPRKEMLEEPTPAGMSVLQEAEKFVREGMHHYPTLRDAAAKRQEKLESERWEKLMRLKEIELRKELAIKEMMMLRQMQAAEKERDHFVDRWKKEVETTKSLAMDLQQSKEREAMIVSSSRKREGELHAKMHAMKKDFGGSSIPRSPVDSSPPPTPSPMNSSGINFREASLRGHTSPVAGSGRQGSLPPTSPLLTTTQGIVSPTIVVVPTLSSSPPSTRTRSQTILGSFFGRSSK